MLRAFLWAAAALDFFPKYLLSHSVKPYSEPQLKAASKWWADFLSPYFKDSREGLESKIYKELYDCVRGTVSLYIGDEDSGAALNFYVEKGPPPQLTGWGKYPGAHGPHIKMMFLIPDGTIAIADRTFDPATEIYHDIHMETLPYEQPASPVTPPRP